MNGFQQLTRFPEWKALYDHMIPLINAGETRFSYAQLAELAMTDIRSPRGRGQFYKFRRELLKNHQLWMEVLPGKGYAVIAAKDHPSAAYRRVGMARRKVAMARAINANVQWEELTPEQRALQAATATVLHELSKTFFNVSKEFARISKELRPPRIDLPKLLENISRS